MVFGTVLLIGGAALLAVSGNTAWMAERTVDTERALLAAENGMNLVLAYLQSEIEVTDDFPDGALPLTDLSPSSKVEASSDVAAFHVDEILAWNGGAPTVRITARAPANSGISDVVLTCDIVWNTGAGTVNYRNWRIAQW